MDQMKTHLLKRVAWCAFLALSACGGNGSESPVNKTNSAVSVDSETPEGVSSASSSETPPASANETPGTHYHHQGQEARSADVFVKLDAQGKELPKNAAEWACVKDQHSGYVWLNEAATKAFSSREAAKTHAKDTAPLCGIQSWSVPTVFHWASLVGVEKQQWFPQLQSGQHYWVQDRIVYMVQLDQPETHPIHIKVMLPEEKTGKNLIGLGSTQLVGRLSSVKSGRLSLGQEKNEYTDLSTGLIWKKCAEGWTLYKGTHVCGGLPPPSVDLGKIQAYLKQRNEEEKPATSWRVPTLREGMSVFSEAELIADPTFFTLDGVFTKKGQFTFESSVLDVQQDLSQLLRVNHVFSTVDPDGQAVYQAGTGRRHIKEAYDRLQLWLVRDPSPDEQKQPSAE